MRKQKLLAALLALVMVMTLLPLTAFAATETVTQWEAITSLDELQSATDCAIVYQAGTTSEPKIMYHGSGKTCTDQLKATIENGVLTGGVQTETTWTITPVDGGYTIQSKIDGNYVDLTNTTTGTASTAGVTVGSTAQTLQITKVDNGFTIGNGTNYIHHADVGNMASNRWFYCGTTATTLAIYVQVTKQVEVVEPDTSNEHVASDGHANAYLNFDGSWGNTLTPTAVKLCTTNSTSTPATSISDGTTYYIYSNDSNTRWMHVGNGNTVTNQCMGTTCGTPHQFIFHDKGDGTYSIEPADYSGHYINSNTKANQHSQLPITATEEAFYVWAKNAAAGEYYIVWEVEYVVREPQLALNYYSGESDGQPMNKTSVNSNYFRIPGITTLSNGWQVAVSDIRWQSAADNPSNMDTIVSISKDNGETWEWETLNYLGDYSIDKSSALSSSFIDPAIVQASNGDIWVAVDLTPFMYNGTRGSLSNNGTGYDEDGYMLVTKVSTAGTGTMTPTNPSVYDYRIDLSGKHGGEATAEDIWGDEHTVYPIFGADGISTTGMYVDKFFNLYETVDGEITPVQCEQYGDYGDWTQNNILYAQSEYRLFPTFYFCLRRGVVQGDGITWDEPIYPDVRDNMATYFFGVCPGRGTIVELEGGGERIMFQCYDNSQGQEYASTFYSDDGGETWQRGQRSRTMGSSGGSKSSESQVIVLPDGNLRMYSRNLSYYVIYADSQDGGVTWGPYYRDSSLYGVYNCMVSFINVDGMLVMPNGETHTDLVMGSYPTSTSRANGTVRIGYMDGTNNVTWLTTVGTFTNQLTGSFQYSCLTQARTSYGAGFDQFGLLYEPNEGGVTCKYISFDVEDVLGAGYYLVPEAPTDEEAAAIIGEVTVSGMLEDAECAHDAIAYQLTADEVTVTSGENVNKTDDGYVAEVTVSVSGLVERYNNDTDGDHTGGSDISVTLVYDTVNKEWTLKEGDSDKLTVTVACNPTTQSEQPTPPVVNPPVTGGDTEIPEDQTPLNPTPDDDDTDIDDTTPLAPTPDDGDTDISDTDTPLDSTPKTGDDSIAIAVLWSIFSISAVGFVSVMLSMKKSGKHTK